MHCAAGCSSGAGALLCSRGEAPVARREREREPPLQWVSNLRGVTTTTTATATPQDFKKSNLRGVAINNNNNKTTKQNQAPDKPSHCSYIFFTLKNIRVAPVNINEKKILEKNIASNTLAAEKSPLTCLTIQVAIKSKQARKLDVGSQIRVGSKIVGLCQQEFEKLRVWREKEFSRIRDGDQREKLVKNQGPKGRSKVKELFFNQMSRKCIIHQPKTFHLKIKVIWEYSIHPSVWELMKWVGSKFSFSGNQDLWFPEGKGFLTMQLTPWQN